MNIVSHPGHGSPGVEVEVEDNWTSCSSLQMLRLSIKEASSVFL